MLETMIRKPRELSRFGMLCAALALVVFMGNRAQADEGSAWTGGDGLPGVTNSTTIGPATDRLDLALGFSSVMLETARQPDDVSSRNPDNSLQSLVVGWRQRAGGRLDYGALLERRDGTGWLVAAGGWLRFGQDEEAAWLYAGLGLLQTTWDERTLYPLVRYGAGIGSRFSSHVSVMFHNMGPIPFSPGYSVAENSGFTLEGQLDLGGLALWGGLERTIRSAGADARLVLEASGGLALTGPTSRFAMGWTMRQGAEARFVPDGNGKKLELRRMRQLMGLTLGYAFSRVNGAGHEDRHAFGITVYPGQGETVMEAPDWSSGRPEFAFEWSASFGL